MLRNALVCSRVMVPMLLCLVGYSWHVAAASTSRSASSSATSVDLVVTLGVKFFVIPVALIRAVLVLNWLYWCVAIIKDVGACKAILGRKMVSASIVSLRPTSIASISWAASSTSKSTGVDPVTPFTVVPPASTSSARWSLSVWPVDVWLIQASSASATSTVGASSSTATSLGVLVSSLISIVSDIIKLFSFIESVEVILLFLLVVLLAVHLVSSLIVLLVRLLRVFEGGGWLLEVNYFHVLMHLVEVLVVELVLAYIFFSFKVMLLLNNLVGLPFFVFILIILYIIPVAQDTWFIDWQCLALFLRIYIFNLI